MARRTIFVVPDGWWVNLKRKKKSENSSRQTSKNTFSAQRQIAVLWCASKPNKLGIRNWSETNETKLWSFLQSDIWPHNPATPPTDVLWTTLILPPGNNPEFLNGSRLSKPDALFWRNKCWKNWCRLFHSVQLKNATPSRRWHWVVIALWNDLLWIVINASGFVFETRRLQPDTE